jgi:VWFA-related protein
MRNERYDWDDGFPRQDGLGQPRSHEARMKSRNGFCLGLILVLGGFGLAAAGVSMAQQSPAPAAAAAAQTAPGAGGASPRREAGTQSFTLRLGVPEEAESAVVIRANTRRVVVDVVVTGPDGKPVPGLTQQDFTVFEDRKPQSVRAFEVHTPEEDRSVLPSAPAELPSHVFVNLEKTPASGPPVVLLLDCLNTPITDQGYAHEQIVHFLERKPASTEVAIFVLGDNLTLLQGFTTDRSRLLAAMRSKAGGIRLTAATERVLRAQTTLDAFWDLGRFLTALEGRKNLLWFSESFDMLVLPKAQDVNQGTLVVGYEAGGPNPGPGATVTSENLISTSAMPGNSTASSSGFSHGIGDMTVLREQMRKVATALAVSQTAVYPIDVRGLAADPSYSAAEAGASSLTANPKGITGTPGMPTTPGGPPASIQRHNNFMRSLDAAHATMEEIAQATGGHAFVNSNGIAAAAGQAVSDGAAYYTLVYAPANLNFDGGLRSIHVALDKPGFNLAYRSAYYATDPATAMPEAVQSGSLAAAMVHGAPEAQGLVFKAQIDPNGAPAMAAADSPLAAKSALNAIKKSKKPQHLSGMVQSYDIRLAILAQQLDLTATPDGKRHVELEIGVSAYAADGQNLGGTKQNIEASMPPAVYAQALQNGMFHNLQVELPVEAASLRLAILDPGNHRAGSLEVALPLPPAQQADAAVPVAPAGAVERK